MSGVFIQILMTRTLDLFTTGSNLKRWRDNLLRSQVAQATTQTPSRAKLLVQLWAGIHESLYSGESTQARVDKILRRVKLSHDY